MAGDTPICDHRHNADHVVFLTVDYGGRMLRMTKIYISFLAVVICASAWSADVYVSLDGSHTAPFDTWLKASTDICASVQGLADGSTVTMSNGTYNLTNTITITNAVTVKSIDGNPASVIVSGYEYIWTNEFEEEQHDRVRCFYATASNAWVIGLTITNGGAIGGEEDGVGGGMDSGYASNCIIRDCYAMAGGGVAKVTCYNCLIINNHGLDSGGGSWNSTLYNCTIANNDGEGIAGAPSYNCISWGNNPSANTYPGIHCCGIGYSADNGCITNDPQFVSATDFRLKSTSPCRDTGTNQAWMVGATDFDGNARIIKGQVDIGAFEFVPPNLIVGAESISHVSAGSMSHISGGIE